MCRATSRRRAFASTSCAPPPLRDTRNAAELARLQVQRMRELLKQQKGGGDVDPQVEHFRWLLEDLRVQLFAQELRTPAPVSVKRLQKAWVRMRRSGILVHQRY